MSLGADSNAINLIMSVTIVVGPRGDKRAMV